MQDGASAHRIQAVKKTLPEVFDNSVVALQHENMRLSGFYNVIFCGVT